MITKDQAQRIKSYVESMLAYETAALHNKICLAKSTDKSSAELMACLLKLTQKNAEETGQQFLSYIDSLTKAEWIEWGGGDCPVAPEDKVQYKTTFGKVLEALACDIRWKHISNTDHQAGDVIAYRIIG